MTLFEIRILREFGLHYANKRISKSLTMFCGSTAWFVSDLVGNHEYRFTHDTAQWYMSEISLNTTIFGDVIQMRRTHIIAIIEPHCEKP